MSCYFVAQIQVHDYEEYQKYLDGVDEVFARYNGKYLAVDESPEVLEGDGFQGRIVIIEFPNREELERWYKSPEYQQLLKHRMKAAMCHTLAVKGRAK